MKRENPLLKIANYITILVLLLLGLLKPKFLWEKTTTFLLFFSLFIFLIFLKKKKFWIKKINFFLLFLIVYFLMSAFFRGYEVRQTIRHEPQPEAYFSDELLFLKTYFLMKEGVSFYPAFAQAIIEHGGMTIVPKEIWGWRMPTAFYFWKYLTPNAFWLQILFIISGCLVLFSSFTIVQHFLKKPYALLSPFLLIPYFLESASNTYFLFIEWWGVMFFIIALNFFFKKRKILSVILFSFALLIRELLVVPMMFFLIMSIIWNKDSKYLIIPLLIFFLGWLIHYLKVFQFLSVLPSLSAGSRLHQPGFSLLQKQFAFNTREYFLVDYRVLIWFSFFSLTGLFFNLIFKKNFRERSLFALTSFLSLGLFTIFAGGIYHEFWALLFMPLVIIFSPAVLNILELMKNHEKKK